MKNHKIGLALAIAAISALSACNDKPMSYGDVNSIIAVMSPEQWEAVETNVYEALEPTIQTVRAEKTFTVTYQEPGAEFWDRLRRFKQLMVVGSANDGYVQEVLAEADDAPSGVGLHQVDNVWANGQTVTLVLLEDGWGPSDLQPYLSDINDMLDGQYRRYAQNRMYVSGIDSALADTLALQAGFTMLLPEVYRWSVTDSTYTFRNDNPDPSELIRQVAVTWRTPAPGSLDDEALLEWRAQLADGYNEPQMVVIEGADYRVIHGPTGEGVELQAQWRNPPDQNWPAGGPLITRSVTCDNQDRTYIMDAWLYAPGKEKYEYMIQLQTLLDTFSCVS